MADALLAVNKSLLKNAAAYFIVPFAVAVLFVIKALLIEGCYGFDAFDDANHTFPSLFISRSILKSGAFPMINLFNNFGTPLPGDCLSFQLSPLAITYTLLPSPAAMTWNRFMMAFLTMVVLTVYFRRYVKPVTASICAFLVIFVAPILHHLAHHHYQMGIFFITLLLLIQESMVQRLSTKHLIFFPFILMLFIFTTSLNIVLVSLMFLAANLLWMSKGCRMRQFAIFCALTAAGFLLAFPETFSFIQQIPISARTDTTYGPKVSFPQMLALLIGGTYESGAPSTNPYFRHLYWSFPLLLFAGIGIHRILKAERDLAGRVILLGVLPLLAVLFLYRFREIHWAIPFLKATDITRFWWPGAIFLMIPVGRSLDEIMHWSKASTIVYALISLICFIVIDSTVGWIRFPSNVWAVAILCVITLFIMVILKTREEDKSLLAPRLLRWTYILLALALGLSRVPLGLQILGLRSFTTCQSNHWYDNEQKAEYAHQYLLNFTEPLSRVVHMESTQKGNAFRIAKHGRLGSDGRTVMLHRRFMDYLLKNKLIIIEDEFMDYHFHEVGEAETLSRLGIRYVIQSGLSPESLGWPLVAQHGFLSLYRNPKPTSIVYLEDEGIIPIDEKRIHLIGNGLKIELPRLTEKQDLVATFVARKGWKAYVDGQERPVISDESLMMRVRVEPGDRQVQFDYHMFKFTNYIISASLAFLILAVVHRLTRNLRNLAKGTTCPESIEKCVPQG